MADVWANSMACHPTATCHIAGCCHLVNSLSRFQSHMPHCMVQSLSILSADGGGTFDQVCGRLRRVLAWPLTNDQRIPVLTAHEYCMLSYNSIVWKHTTTVTYEKVSQSDRNSCAPCDAPTHGNYKGLRGHSKKICKVRFNIDIRKYFFQIVLLTNGTIWIRTLSMHLVWTVLKTDWIKLDPQGWVSSWTSQLQGLKYLKMSTTHREGRWRDRRPRARHSPSPVWGSGTLPPENFDI